MAMGDDPTTTTPKRAKRRCRRDQMVYGTIYENCVDTYCSLAGISNESLPKVYTPFDVETGDDFGLGVEREGKWTTLTNNKVGHLGAPGVLKTAPACMFHHN